MKHSSSICCSSTASWQRASVGICHAIAPAMSIRHSLRGIAWPIQHQHSQQRRCNRGSSVKCKAAPADEPAQAAAQQVQDAGAQHSSGDLESRQSSGSSRSGSLSSIDEGMSVHLADTGLASLALTAAASQSNQLHSTQLPVPAAVAEVVKANEETESVNRLDIYKAIGVGGAVSVLAGVLAHEWVSSRRCVRSLECTR
jgi:hypothetical protein